MNAFFSPTFRPMFCWVATWVLCVGCGTTESEPAEVPPSPTVNAAVPQKLFSRVPGSGIDFVNQIEEDGGLNFFKYQYLYNGGGVAIGDVNQDGLDDIYLTGNLVPDRLYLNQGGLRFRDASQEAGIQLDRPGWTTGVSMADVNDDGMLDIYVCRSGWFPEPDKRRNLLFINQGKGKFKEMAAIYGLDDAGHSVLGAFFDYDRDGDLDMYLTNHPIAFKQKLGARLENMKNPSEAVRDKLFRNDGGQFTEVSRAAGIVNYGHGLGLSVVDLDGDGWQDIYVANDFQSPDFFYHNDGDGTFTEQIDASFRHMSYFSMGCDAADINNDGHPDLMVVEMLAEDNRRQKTNMASMNPELFWTLVDMGFRYQFMRNVLHLNNGNGTFSEIAYQAGLATTDWSWGPLFADFDLDGDQDLIVTNGYLHDTQDKDFVIRSNKLAAQHNNQLSFDQVNGILPSTRLQNYAFENVGDFGFKKVSTEWGFNFAGYSNGVAYGDLDNDGDLDVVVNNINDPALVYQNQAVEQKRGRYLNVRLVGPAGNRDGHGAVVTLQLGEQVLRQQFTHVHGFQSSCAYRLHFGLGSVSSVPEVEVTWPDGRQQVLRDVPANQTLVVQHSEAVPAPNAPEPASPILEEISADFNALFVHRENVYDDYARELLLPHQESRNGPKLSSGTVNLGGEQPALYVSGAKGQSGALLVGKRLVQKVFPDLVAHADREDMGSVFFDADGDGDDDLYVVSGGNEYDHGDLRLQDRLYVQDAEGGFRFAPEALPNLKVSGSCVKAADFDGDGDLDLFVGGRQVPGRYAFPGRSALLRNDGGRFTDVTASLAPDLLAPGMVTDALWTDCDADGRPDLLVTGEWMPVMVFRNSGGKLEDVTTTAGLADNTGWWNALAEVDLDGDGDLDYIAGNLGLNYKYKASAEAPFQVYNHDFDGNGSLDIVLGYYNGATCFPVRGRQCSSEQMPMIKEKYPTYSDFGQASLKDIYGEQLDGALRREATNFATCIVRNQGDGTFALEALPPRAQFAPVQGIVARDFTGDGRPDLLLAGNWFVAEVETGRADAGIGLLLEQQADGQFTPILPEQSGFFAREDVRDLITLDGGKGNSDLVIVSANDAPLRVFRLTEPSL
ncbi:MAG: CRTAC1 family protein [Bacteroidota bacterium]